MSLSTSSTVLVIMAMWVTGGAVATTQTGAQATVSAASIKKVVDMLTEMTVVGKKELNEEQVEYAKFSQDCSSSTAAFKKQISEESQKIEVLSSENGALEVEIKELADGIAKLKASEVQFSADLKAQEEERAETHTGFLAEQTDYTESVSALERAITVLQKKDYDIPGTSAVLLQLQGETSKLPAQAKKLVGSFLTMIRNDEAEFLSAPPEANAYDFQSSGIISMLKKLLDEFRAKLTECQKTEMNSVHAYNMVVQDLRDSIKNAQADATDKSTLKAGKEAKLGMNKKDLAMSEEVLASTKKMLSDKVTECDAEALYYEDKQRVRKQELEAIAKAIEILTSEPMKTGEKYIDLNQVRSKAPALAQLRNQNMAEGVRLQVRQFLSSEAVRLHSNKIALLAQKIAADPFAKVKKMIDDMITRLLEEAHADADHEGFCDEEMGKSKVTRDKLSSEIDMLTQATKSSEATIMSLTQEIATLTTEVAEIQKTVTEATALRKEEKATNKQTVEEAEQAQTAVADATAVLKKFYEGALVPVPRTFEDSGKMGSPEWDQLANPNFKGTIADKPITYTGQQESVGGVFALLEVILSDFANVAAETTAEEATMQKKYDELMVQSEKSIATKEKKIEMNTADKASAESGLQSQTADLKGTQDELIAANKYYERLVPQCVDQGMTFEERTAARQEEIASLKMALKLLTARTTL